MSDEGMEVFRMSSSDEEILREHVRTRNADLYFNPAKEERLKFCMQAFLAEYLYQQKANPWKDEKMLDIELFQSWHKWATLYTKEAGDQQPDDHLEHWLPQSEPEPEPETHEPMSLAEYIADTKKKLGGGKAKK